MTRCLRAAARLLAVLGTIAWVQGSQMILATAPHAPAVAIVDTPAAIGAAAAISNLWRALR